MTCPRCNASIPDGAPTCPNCGGYVADMVAAEAQKYVPAAPPVPEAQPIIAAAQPAQMPPQPVYAPPPPGYAPQPMPPAGPYPMAQPGQPMPMYPPPGQLGVTYPAPPPGYPMMGVPGVMPAVPQKKKSSVGKVLGIIFGTIGGLILLLIIIGIIGVVLEENGTATVDPPEVVVVSPDEPEPEPEPIDVDVFDADEVYGTNGLANAYSWGYSAVSDEYLFVADPNNGGITRYNLDCTDPVAIVPANKKNAKEKDLNYYYWLQVYDGKLYAADYYGVVSMDFDGKKIDTLWRGNAWYITFAGDKIAFLDYTNQTLYCMNTDGKKLTSLADGNCRYLAPYKGYIYYVEYDDEKIYRVSPDEPGKPELLLNTYSFGLAVNNGWLYYTTYSANSPSYLRRVKIEDAVKNPNTSDYFTISANNVGMFNITADGWIYVNEYSSGKTYRMRSDGTERERVADELWSIANISGNYIFYGIWDSDKEIYHFFRYDIASGISDAYPFKKA